MRSPSPSISAPETMSTPHLRQRWAIALSVGLGVVIAGLLIVAG
jgi:hypothetical protein